MSPSSVLVSVSGLIWEQFDCSSLNLCILLGLSTVEKSRVEKVVLEKPQRLVLMSCAGFGMSHVFVHPQTNW